LTNEKMLLSRYINRGLLALIAPVGRTI